MGGLGNQLFQYFAGKYFSATNAVPVCFDVGWIDFQNPHLSSDIRDFNFTANDQFLSPSRFGKTQEKLMRMSEYFSKLTKDFAHLNKRIFISDVFYSGELTINQGTRIVGYFQNLKYYSEFISQNKSLDWSQKIQNEFTDKMIVDITQNRHILVHVRGRDFLSKKSPNVNLSRNYYDMAINILRSTAPQKIYVVTDDYIYASKVLEGIPNLNFLGQDNFRASDVFRLLKSAERLVISNSTLSYWAGIASTAQVVAPDRWLNGETGIKNVYPNDWQVIDGSSGQLGCGESFA